MAFSEKSNLSQNSSVHGVYHEDNWAVMQLESENAVKVESLSIQLVFNQSKKGIMGMEALKITNRNMTMEVIIHNYKLQGKQWNIHPRNFLRCYKIVKDIF